MKKLIAILTVTAFAFGTFAGDACCDKAKTAEKDKACCAAKSAGSCPAGKEAGKCPAAGANTASAKKPAVTKKAESPKGSQANKS